MRNNILRVLWWLCGLGIIISLASGLLGFSHWWACFAMTMGITYVVLLYDKNR